ncbi:LysR family transcriptional regulator [Shewanella sp. NIFS-20-20]|uniref:LysR family transcriptional regulator n=1 Tax=Shewanella sp. NIFS-20-20 TaxID=2853806 RepID=UPI001C43776F|nr:LysR family transcriptional regulator [Shewanella sp. NIFS-20-20]MBV7316523.1 LysR family transcriptional regulator [Shewanella sp. NIFS-20-20]
MTEKLDLNLFTVFALVYRHQSITLAAEQLEVTQAAVSGAIKRLSLQCGQDIFVRKGRGIVATQYAHQLMQQLAPALDIMAGVLDNMQVFDCKNTKINFTVLALESVTNLIQPHALALQQQGNPLIIFKEEHSSEAPILEALLRQQADLAIDNSTNLHSSLQSEPLFDETIVVICRRDHPRVQASVTREQYLAEQHIRLHLTRANMSAVDYFAMADLSARKVVAEASSLLSLAALVAQSDCLGACARTLAHKYQQAFNLQIIEMPVLVRPIPLSMIWHRRNQDNPAHLWLRQAIKEMVVKALNSSKG